MHVSVGLRDSLDTVKKRKNLLPLPRIEPLLLSQLILGLLDVLTHVTGYPPPPQTYTHTQNYKKFTPYKNVTLMTVNNKIKFTEQFVLRTSGNSNFTDGNTQCHKK